MNEIHDLLRYDPESGNFYWKLNRGRLAKAGDVAGTLVDGYIKIKIKGKLYAAHRLVFLLEDGVFPEGDVDHKNKIKYDNRRVNLRKATRRQNLQNTPARSNNKLGVKNVDFKKDRYRVVLRIDGKPKYIGSYEELELATLVAEEARSKYYGEFA